MAILQRRVRRLCCGSAALRARDMSPGNFVSMPKEMRHYALSKTATIVQVNAIGPFKVNWVNPSDVIPPDAKPAK
jgi:hypothetical protein